VLIALSLPLLWLDLLQLPIAVVIPNLESSWWGAIIHFSARGLQYGSDVVFTHGPFGYLISPVYTGELFPARVAWELVSKAIFVVILGLTLIRLPILWRPLFLLFVLLFVWAEGASDAVYFLIISCLAVLLFKHGSSSSALNIFAGALFAVFSLIKFTYFLLVIIVLGLTAACYCKLRRTSQAILVGLVFFASFLLCWWIAKQEYRHLLSYFTTSLDISFGYKEAMALPAANHAIVLAGVIAALLGLIQCVLILLDSRHPAVLFTALFIAGETFLSWNRAFIRSDDHVLSFFCLHPVLLAAMWIVAQPRRAIRWTGYTINLLVFVICLFGFSQQRPGQLSNRLHDTMGRIKSSWGIATGLRAFSEQFDTILIATRNTYALPRVQAEVRDATIDVLGNEQAIALLNNLNYTPRPVFQGYTAYTPKLINLNTAFYSSTKAPAYVLFKNQTIDNRYPTLDDAGVLKQLLYNYKPLLEEKGYLLWKRIQPTEPVQSVAAVTESLTFDLEHAIPANEIVWLELDIRQSLAGRALGLLYKPPAVAIRVTDTLGRQSNDRLVPSMASTGFIVSPSLRSSWQILRTASGTQSASGGSFSIQVADESHRFFQPTMVCRMATLPAVPKSDLDERARLMSDEVIVEKQETSQRWLLQLFDDSTEVLLRLDSRNGFDGISLVQGTRFAREEQGLRITSTGADPPILLPAFSTGSQGGAIFRIDLIVPIETSFQVFYLPAGAGDYAGRILDQSLRRGENTVYFFLRESQLMGGRLRAKTGMSTGDYVITNVEARSVSPETFQR
jgi:hypothetical protein